MIEITDDVRANYTNLTDKIFKEFPPSEFNYILIGRSPTPIYAIMSIVSNAYPHVKPIAVPLSEAGHLRSFLELETAQQDATLYPKKLFDHFDIYLGEFFEEMKRTGKSKKFVVVDYTQTGHSLGMSKLAFDWYFRFRFGTRPDLIEYAKKGGIFPHTEYLAISDPRFSSTEELQLTIDSYKTKYSPRVSGVLDFAEVLPGQVYGTNSITVEIDWLEEVLNQRTGDDEWHWQGKIIELTETEFEISRDFFVNQTFDDHAPYGGWRIHVEPLENGIPEINESFLYLRESFFDCN